VEADRKGSILAIIRIGNKDLQAPGGDGAGLVVPVGLSAGAGMGAGGTCGPDGGACGPNGAGGNGGGLAAYMAGVTAPSYGMPITGTPIGLPGPPHIPLGVPAGLQRHVMRNHTHMHIPGPVEKMRIDVQQRPGLSYPKPVDHVRIVETSRVPHIKFTQPLADRTHIYPGEMPRQPQHHGLLHHGAQHQGGNVCEDGTCVPGENCEPSDNQGAAISDYDSQ
jgi:hypothetical protein